MANSIHPWVVDKTDCSVFDVHCETNRDCSVACKILHSEDGHEIVTFMCNKDSGRCNPVIHSSWSMVKAAEDLARIKKHLAEFRDIPETFVWFIEHDGGKLFVSKRARYYDTLALAIGGLGDIDELARDIRLSIAKTLRKNLGKKLEMFGISLSEEKHLKVLGWINEITAEASIDYAESLESLNINGTRKKMSLKEFLDDMTGGVKYHDRIKKVTANNDILAKELEENEDGKREENEPLTDIEPQLTLVSMTRARKESSLLREIGENAPLIDSRSNEYLCNEEMHAGRAEAIYIDESSKELVAVCACTYPEYLVGPTCHQRTYRYVIDYEKWTRTGFPEFLTDPVKHFKKAESVCAQQGNSTLAVYDPEHRAFVCAPIAEVVKTALTFRGPHEPSLIIERDINKPQNAPSKTFGVNWSYVNLLERIGHPM
uniref:Wsv306-like protein n=1 Tax=Metapenaeus ensis nimavirus TaxID=2133794 RepID=A0A401IPF2_9VIRU|nr:MAG: wsv306-like protein [Metapenaeus ensis nimavirus]GBG35493.1 wsv306-like protein [Metapenaeus ensis nimavirus]